MREELESHRLRARWSVNVLGQSLLARRMARRRRIIAEIGAGACTASCVGGRRARQLGLQCARLEVAGAGRRCRERQKPNVFRMKMLGAEVVPVQSGAKTLKDAMNEALRDWVTNVVDTYYCIGTVAGPHPYPARWCAISSRSSATRPASRCRYARRPPARRIR